MSTPFNARSAHAEVAFRQANQAVKRSHLNTGAETARLPIKRKNLALSFFTENLTAGAAPFYSVQHCALT